MELDSCNGEAYSISVLHLWDRFTDFDEILVLRFYAKRRAS
jgi:hypothetical protein